MAKTFFATIQTRPRNSSSRGPNTALVALALLTAQSDPKQKDLVIRLIMNLIT